MKPLQPGLFDRPPTFVVSFSGGIGSFCAAERVIEAHGADRVELVFCDTLVEDEDLYRFLDDAEQALGLKIVRLKDGRDPWGVFRDERFIGNTRSAQCSKFLKRRVFKTYIDGKYAPSEVVVVLGMDWTEEHRAIRGAKFWSPRRVVAPLCDPPFLTKEQMLARLVPHGIAPPRLYGLGFAHNNCGGGCVRAGVTQWRMLFELMPLRFLWWEEQEQAVLREIPTTRPFLESKGRHISLRQFREEFQAGAEVDKYDFGGCGCFVDLDEDDIVGGG